MKRVLSSCFLSLLFFSPAVIWSQDVKSSQLGQAPPSERVSLIAQPQDSSNAISTETTAMKKGPMFPDSLMKNYEVETFQGVLKMADLAGFAYNDVLEKAKAGDAGAIFQLLDFYRMVEGKDAINHAVTTLELIPLAGDDAFSAAVSQCKPKLKKAVLDRLTQAQGRTKKEFLRPGMAEWAPITWAVLNGLPVDENVGENANKETQPASSKKQ